MSESSNYESSAELRIDAQMSEDTGKHTVQLAANHEWRFEVAFEKRITVRLVEGTAELFGTELTRGREYEISGQNAAIFTFHGCKLEWEGDCSEYVALNAMMARYVSVHFALEKQRREAESTGSAAPRLMILGSRNSGKSTLAKILVSYATKMGHFPMLVNLDPKSPVFSPPGSLVGAPVSHILDIEDGFGLSPINGPATTHHKQPLVFTYGLQDPAESPAFYGHLVSKLAKGINERLLEDTRVAHSGIVVDTPDSFSDIDDEQKLNLVCQCVSSYHINAILVIGKERLTSKLQKLLSNDTQILNISQSGGLTEDDSAFDRQIQRKAIAEYFFGNPRQTLSPFTVTVSLSSIVVYRPLEVNEITATDDDEFFTKVEPSAVLQNCLLAVVNAAPTDSTAVIANAETLGYVRVVEADETRKILKLLLPVPGTAPKKAFVMGSYRYHE